MITYSFLSFFEKGALNGSVQVLRRDGTSVGGNRPSYPSSSPTDSFLEEVSPADNGISSELAFDNSLENKKENEASESDDRDEAILPTVHVVLDRTAFQKALKDAANTIFKVKRGSKGLGSICERRQSEGEGTLRQVRGTARC